MTREEAAKILPIITAFAEGKEIQSRCIWYDDDDFSFDDDLDYRIKPEPKYRPFKNAEECWQEMQKHQPFGWVYSIRKGSKLLIREISKEKFHNKPVMQIDLNGTPTTFQSAFYQIRFVDSTTFGIRERD